MTRDIWQTNILRKPRNISTSDALTNVLKKKRHSMKEEDMYSINTKIDLKKKKMKYKKG